ncbi:MAG TPA: adenylate/guanylate cyclase domain-containing protein [Candidatus Binataceae bacterium]|nr:adenylate/guanylate cyclase domain-containing protein [Candidatus Binataceae bacterium]
MHCAKCGFDNREGRKFCAQCGTALNLRCSSCGAENTPGEKFCGECGAALAAGGAAASAHKASELKPTAPGIRVTPEHPDSSAILEGERKTVTALFADIKGSMELMEDLDPEEARAIVDPALKLMIDAAHRYDGYIVQSTGDGIFALFGAPVAHEDHPQRALYAALRMQDEVKRHAEKLRAERGLNLQVRVGVNSGEVVVRSIKTAEAHTEYTPIGHSTSLASRLQALAAPGSIAISETVRKLVEGYFALKAMGPARIKGVSEPVNVYEVTGLGPLRTRLQRSAGRGLTKFVGREREMDAMKAAADRATSGRGQIVAAMAEAGAGKSRLFFEFKAKNQSGWMVLETFSVSHGKASAYFPVIDLLHGYFKIEGEDDQRARRVKVNGNVLTLDRSLEDTLPYLFALLGIVEGDDPLAQMDAQIKKRRTLEAIKRILLRESLNQPLMVIFEDLHWIDEETQAFLNLLADSIGTAKILLLVNYRPEYSHQWNSKTYYTQLRLDPLGKESAEEMLSALLFQSPLPPGEGQGEGADISALKRLIIEKAEGNPFFMEETVQVLLDEGVLVREESRAGTPAPPVRLTKALGELKIPPTVQGILAARIDRLAQDAKDLLQTLAVIGREFPLSLIRAVVAKSDDKLNRMLNDLQLGEFIYEQPAVGDTEYIFKHALTQEVAYNSVLIERRKQLHERIGAALETLYASSLDDHLAELAHHYCRGNNPGKAVDYLGRAAQQAASRSAFNEALVHARAGVALISALPATAERGPREFDLLSALVRAAVAIEGWGSPQTAQGYRRMLELARESGGDSELSTALYGSYLDNLVLARHQEASEMAGKMLEVSARTKNPAELADAHTASGWTLITTGHVGESLNQFNRALEFGANGATGLSVEGLDHLAWALSGTARANCVAGYPDRAVNLIESAIKRSRELNQPFSLVYALFWATVVRSWRGEVLETQHLCEQIDALAEEGGFASFVALNRIFQGWDASMQGQPEQGIALIRKGIADWKNPFFLTHHSSILAEACVRAGRYQEAIDAVAAGREHAQRTGEHFAESEIERIAGGTLLLMGAENAAEAERCMRRGIAIAKEQGARSFELRATTSLARLLRGTNRRGEARAMLAEIYNWFTEGFDTADLKDAKKLLDELNA